MHVQSKAGQTPSRLGRYELLARLATGGMGEIFLGRLEGAAGFEKLYVVKRVLPHLADDPRFRTMLIDEAHIASKMSHPNICQVYELGDADGQLFIVMEYLEGVTLLPVLRQAAKGKHPLAVGLVAGVIQQTCDALHYAHELTNRDGSRLGVVHRDVTPSNLFLTETGIVKVLDFGIAKVKDASANTQTGTVKGKYAYMAPEQLRSEEIDRRVDVFAMGVVAFEMLALRRLFQRKTDYLTFRAVMELPIPNLREFRPDVPARLAEVITRSLERDPAARFATARQFGAELTDAIAGHSKPWTSSEIGDYIRQHFGDDLRRRGSAVSVAIQREPGQVGKTTMPVLTPLNPAPEETTSDDDFPSIDTNVHRLAEMARDAATPTSPTLPPRISGEGSDDHGTPLTELAPPPVTRRKKDAPATASVAVVAPGRGLLWKLFAVGLVGVLAVGGFILYRLWQRLEEQSQPPPTFNVIGSGTIEPVDLGAQARPDAAPAVVEVADAAPAVVASVDASRSGGTQDRVPRTKDEIAALVGKRLERKLGALQACVDTHQDLARPGMILAVTVGPGQARAEVRPPAVNNSPLGACLRKVAQGIEYGSFAAPHTALVPLQTTK